MKHFIFLTTIAILFSIKSYSQEEKINSINLIEINSDIKFNWDNATSKIIKDKLWKKLKTSYQTHKKTLIQEVSNHKLTKAKVCKVKGYLTKGQMAFIILDQLEDIPYALIFKAQYCISYLDCPYIGGLIESIKYNKNASEQLMHYFYKEKK